VRHHLPVLILLGVDAGSRIQTGVLVLICKDVVVEFREGGLGEVFKGFLLKELERLCSRLVIPLELLHIFVSFRHEHAELVLRNGVNEEVYYPGSQQFIIVLISHLPLADRCQ